MDGACRWVMAVSQYRAESARLSLLEREAEVATSESRLAAYRDDIDEVTGDVAQRMEFLEEATEMLPDDVVAEDTVSDSTDEAAKAIAKIRAVMPEAADLARLEALIREVEKSVRPGAVKRWLNRPSRIFAGEVPRHLVVQRRGAFLLERLREAIARFTL